MCVIQILLRINILNYMMNFYVENKLVIPSCNPTASSRQLVLAYPYFSYMPSLPHFVLLLCLLPLTMQKQVSPGSCWEHYTIPNHHLVSFKLLKVSGTSFTMSSLLWIRFCSLLSGFLFLQPDKLLLSKCVLTSINLALQIMFSACFLWYLSCPPF